MRYLVGLARCMWCGEKTTTVTRRDFSNQKGKGGPITCLACGAKKAEAVTVYYPAELWPEIAALTAFADEREKLQLPPLTDAEWQ